LQQPESSPVSVSEQIILLLALTAKLFDEVPLENMGEAERAVRAVVLNIPPELLARMEADESLNDADRHALLWHARTALDGLGSAHAKAQAQVVEAATAVELEQRS
jgi:F-type H+-transporting ATPase subunit alpha